MTRYVSEQQKINTGLPGSSAPRYNYCQNSEPSEEGVVCCLSVVCLFDLRVTEVRLIISSTSVKCAVFWFVQWVLVKLQISQLMRLPPRRSSLRSGLSACS